MHEAHGPNPGGPRDPPAVIRVLLESVLRSAVGTAGLRPGLLPAFRYDARLLPAGRRVGLSADGRAGLRAHGPGLRGTGRDDLHIAGAVVFISLAHAVRRIAIADAVVSGGAIADVSGDDAGRAAPLKASPGIHGRIKTLA
jgi:hypothetical protein